MRQEDILALEENGVRTSQVLEEKVSLAIVEPGEGWLLEDSRRKQRSQSLQSGS